VSPLSIALLIALSGSPALKGAEKAYQDLEFDKAEKLYLQALGEPGTREERLATYKGLGLSQAFMGEAKEARASFEKLLLLDPETRVDASMGPKIAKPFEAARKAIGRQRNVLLVSRDAQGQVVARLAEDEPLAKEYSLHARAKGEGKYTSVTVLAGQPLTMSFEPSQTVEVYAEARDANDGVLYFDGTEGAPRVLMALRSASAVAAAVDDARHQDERRGSAPKANLETIEDEDEGVSTPVLVGIGAVILAGAAAGVVIATQPPALNLPSADRTGQLP
jgi:tetratricopeptide (TPR) repeat protein